VSPAAHIFGCLFFHGTQKDDLKLDSLSFPQRALHLVICETGRISLVMMSYARVRAESRK
jgi:hypothetical protein